MRNLKKILSLALALVMVFSLMTFASAKDFNDAGDIEYTEAVEVLTALEVIDGVGNNTFNPNGKVTRAQMAKMITLISLGNVSVDAFNGVTVDLNDISGHWAEAYIKYCYSQGIISGKGNGRFDPDANVTAVEAAKMLLVALGYNSDVQVYEGPSWNVNVIRDAQINDIFEDMTGVASNIQISRDQAAQMMYNTLTTGIIEKGSEQSREDGSISDTYKKNDDKTLLQQSFKADVWVGTFDGNDKVAGGANVKGEIAVTGALESNYTGASGSGYNTASFPFDFDIANIGEEVKVIYKDGTMGVKGRPDKYDTIYGVYKTNGTTVYNITRGDLQNAESDTAKDKIKFGGSKYELAKNSASAVVGSYTIPVVLNYASEDNWTADNINTSNDNNAITKTNGLRGQSVDTIKFIANDEGKLIKAYVTEYNIGRVAAVTSSKVTIEGIGAIDIDGNDIYDGIAVDDVVVYTRFYDKDDKDEATFTVTLAETAEGELTGFKTTDNVVIAGTTYKLNRKTLKDVTDDEITAVESNDIGTDVRAYLVNGMVAAIQKLEEKGGKFALVLEKTDGTPGATVGGLEVNLLLTDGTEQTAYVHKDSTINGTDKLDNDDQIPVGSLIEYSSISDGKVKVYKVAGATGITSTSGAAADVDAPVNGKIWNKDTKAMTYKDDTTAVAAANATLFVLVDANGDQIIQPSEKTYAYSLRDLGNIALAQYNTGTAQAPSNHDQQVAYFLNDDGLIAAAYLVTGARPGSGTASTLYGIVTGYTGSRRDADDTDFQLFNVAVNGGETKEVRIEAATEALAVIKKGDLVTFDETTNGEYAPADFDVLVTADDTAPEDWTLGAVDSYKSGSNLLTYFAETWKNTTSNLFEGKGTASSATTDKDVKIIYVNGKDCKAGDEVGVGKFGTEKGYANILFHKDDDGVVDVMIVESTGEANLAKRGDNKPDKKEFATTNFGTATKTTAVITLGTLTKTGVTNGVTVGTPVVKRGATTLTQGSTETLTAGETLTVEVPLTDGTATKATTISLGTDVTVTNVSVAKTTGTITAEADKTVTVAAGAFTGATITFTVTVDAQGSSKTIAPAVTVATKTTTLAGNTLSTTDLNTAIDTATTAGSPIEITGAVTPAADIAIPAGAKVTFKGAVAAHGTDKVTVAAGAEVTFEGDCAAPIEVAAAGTITATGKTLAKVETKTAANVSIEADTVTELVATNGTLTVEANVGDVTVTAGTTTITGDVSDVKDVVASQTLKVTGNVAAVTALNGTLEVTNGTVALGDSAIKASSTLALKGSSSTTVDEDLPAATISLEGTATLTLDGSADDVSVATATLSTSVGTTSIIVKGDGTTKGVTLPSTGFYDTSNTLVAAKVTAATTTFKWDAAADGTNTAGFLAQQ